MKRCVLSAGITLGAVALSHQQRAQGYVPNKGYRVQPPVPDRLKDAMDQMGVNAAHVTQDGHDPKYIPEEQRHRMVTDIMSNTSNMRNHGKMDRLRAALDTVHNEPADHPGWNDVYLFLRTTEMCTELLRDPTDVFPKGQKLWVELELCEEKRVPVLMEMENGVICLPIFSMEEYMDEYFGRTDVYESCWFPVPRMGSRWEEFCKLPFPVGATGRLKHHSALATVALPYQFPIALNPGQRTSKFLTYPEMVELAQIASSPLNDRSMTLQTTNAEGHTSYLFDENLIRAFDTRKMKMRRVEPRELADKLRARPPLPPIAQLELQILMCPYPEITHVFVRTVDRPRWKRLMGGAEKMTQLDVVCAPDQKPDKAFFSHLQRWSFMREFHSDVHVELTDKPPQSQAGVPSMCVYQWADGKMLRDMTTFKGKLTIADSVDYNAPLRDDKGREVYVRDTTLF